MANSDERAARLAAQLRANLHRRKAQARAVAAEGNRDVASQPAPPAPETADQDPIPPR
ncbi:hypothetical protein [Sphingomonas sp. S6]|jgi:hypothetical protein|uniref:hypothetical protein n=1 Tax=Sphingomonas sp. S6 TaxID=3368600 RepID=UPI0028E4C617|nr:hypothetical protein [uncultured Sphingomonas sp.]